MSNETTVTEIKSLEQARCRALNTQDHAALADLVADDVVHVHTSGRVEGKAAYLEGVRERFVFSDVVRGDDLTVRVYGDVAVATGPLRQLVRVKATGQELKMHIFTTQIWTRQQSRWRQSGFQATTIA